MSETNEGVKVNFDDMKAPSQEKYIGTVGIWRGAVIKSFSITPVKLKDATKPESATNKKTGGWLEMILENEKDGKFTVRHFPLPVKPDDVAYVGKVYGTNGEELRDRTKAEQMQEDYKSFAYFMIQIAMALGNEFDNAKRIVTPNNTFESMVDATRKAFMPVFPTPQKVDFKTIWQNSDKNKTSYLQMPKAGVSNIVIARHDPNAPLSTVQFTAYEKKSGMIEKYPYQQKAAASANPNIVGAPAGAAAAYDLPPVAGGGSEDLF
jgi:hypothetical protein